MPKVSIKKDKHDNDMVRIYAQLIQEGHVDRPENFGWILAGSMHRDAVEMVFGKSVIEQLYEEDRGDIYVTAETLT